MERIPEPELMLEPQQVEAYAHADFDEPHSMFIQLFKHYFPDELVNGMVLDLGCGTADISCRFARAFPDCAIDGVDASETMLSYGRNIVIKQGFNERIHLLNGYVPNLTLPRLRYDVALSNSLLHHLANPLSLWETIKRTIKPSGAIFIMDLLRPSSREEASYLVNKYAKNEPEILQRDFFNSLLAAYSIAEVEAQLQTTDFYYLEMYEVSDRHWVAVGRL
ncbi:MAG: class I SAM-dependent methyltransferase [Thiotrichaceae bacterium]